MAKQMYFVSGDQHRAMERRWADVLRRISGMGTTLNPQLVLDRLQEMIEMPAGASQPSNLPPVRMPRLINGLFSPPAWKIANVRRWNSVFEWGFTEEDFKNLPPPPPVPDLLCATVVLVPYLETPLKTYRELRKVIEFEHWASDLSGMILLEGWGDALYVCGVEHKPGLRWEVIDMAGGQMFRDETSQGRGTGGGVVSAFDTKLLPPAERLPHAGVLAELAHSPYWARSLSSNGGTAPEIWIPGYVIGDTRFHLETAWNVGDGKHLHVHAHSNIEPYAPHRKSLHVESVNMSHRTGFNLATPVLL